MQTKFVILASIFGVISALSFSTNQSILLSLSTALIASSLYLAAYLSKDKKDRQIEEIHQLATAESKSEKEISKPELTIELIPTPSFCSSFNSELPNETINIHRTAIILYLKITNMGNAPTEIGQIHVGYESMENNWHWLRDETTLLDDFTMPMGEKVKVFPFLKQSNFLMKNDIDTFLNPGQSCNGIVYFEQKASSGNLYPKMDENFKVRIQILVNDTKGHNWSIEQRIPKVKIDAAREHCPHFGKTLLLAQGD